VEKINGATKERVCLEGTIEDSHFSPLELDPHSDSQAPYLYAQKHTFIVQLHILKNAKELRSAARICNVRSYLRRCSDYPCIRKDLQGKSSDN
jgi:hypothetical protein